MSAAIVQSGGAVTLLGGAPLETELLKQVLALAPVLVAADSGADTALAAGYRPEAVIGDMDSLSDAARRQLGSGVLHKVTEQDSTDFDKALDRIAAPIVLAVGFTGARLDHELAVYNALVRHRAGAAIVIGESDLAFHAPRHLRLDLPVGTRLSLFPMRAMRGTSTGLRWPIDGLALAPDGRVATSNAVRTSPVTLALDGPGMLAILPRTQIRPAVRALWPGAGDVPAR